MSLTIAVITTTVETQDQADTLANSLTARHLAACVQADPITSFFVWNGTATQSTEIKLTLKTPKTREAALVAAILAEHPYEVPEILRQDAETTAAYLAWAEEVTAPTA